MLIKTKLLAIPVPPRPENKKKSGNINFVSDAVSNGTYLAVYIWETNGNLLMRWFTDGTNSIKYDEREKEWSVRSVTSIIAGSPWYTANDDSPPAAADTWFTFFRKPPSYRSMSLIGRCMEFDRDRRSESQDRQESLERDRMKEHAKCWPDTPKGVYAFADTKMPQYLLFGNVDGKKRDVRCTACGARFRVPKDQPVHKQQTTCPKCGHAARWFARRYNPPKSKVPVWIVQRKENTLFYKYTRICRYFEDGKKTYIEDDDKRLLDTVEHGKRRVYVYTLVNAAYIGWHWKRQPFGDVYASDAWIFPETLPEAFPHEINHVIPAMLSGIDHKADPYVLTELLRKYPQAEYFAKSGMWRLLQQMWTLGHVIEIPKNLRHLAKIFNLSLIELKSLRETGPVPDDRFAAVRKIRGYYGSANLIKQLGIDRYIRYFGRQYALYPNYGTLQVDGWYLDYLGMCKEQNIDTSHKSVRFPPDIKQAHDQLADRIKIERAQNWDKAFAKKVKTLYAEMQGYTDADYTVVFPQLRTDLIREGTALSHCVGGDRYAENHMKGVNMIFFIRAAANPEKPLYTLEGNVKTGNVVQLYGYGDSAAPKKAHAFCKKFLKNIWKPQIAAAV